jgi:GTP-binding protein
MHGPDVSAQDHDIAKYLRKLGKPCVLTANKAEGMHARRAA